MIIDRDIANYIVLPDEPIITALQKIAEARSMVIMAVDHRGVLEGLFTNGDFLRWVIREKQVDLNQPVERLLNRNYTSVTVGEKPEKIEKHLETLYYIPIVDERGHLVAVARRRESGLKIGDFVISDATPTFVIAEIGNNHNGSLTLAKEMIDLALEAGADCVKFQMRHLSSLYKNQGNPDDEAENLNSQYTLDLLTRFQLSTEEMFEAFDYCRARGGLPLCTPWDIESLRALQSYGLPAYKVASADLTNHDFLMALIETGKPLICSTGMSTEEEIKAAAALLQYHGAQYVLMHCNSTYPAPFKDINLNYLPRLKEIAGAPIGYSGHERGYNIAVSAVVLGARVVEKHFTVDREMEGSDHKVSLLPDEFKAMVEGIRQVEAALGSSAPRQITQGEIMNRANLAKSLVINRALKPGELITEEMIEVKSPGRGLQPYHKKDLIGVPARRHFQPGDFFFLSDIREEVCTARDYRFGRPWGVPVRYHDFKFMLSQTNPDLLEFHLSYKDMDVELKDYLDQVYDLDLVVHSPELFKGDHLMNLCSEDKAYRQRSIDELQRVIDITRALKPFFARATVPVIIINAGGFTKDGFLPASSRAPLYERIAESLTRLDEEGVEVIPQTYPPFPWLFGGQFHHNLFLNPHEIADFCQQYDRRVCFDISHSKLACNHLGLSFKEFVDLVGPYTAHIHMADAKDVDGEGVQIAEGDIDFAALADDLARTAPAASFIPEIWRGHESNGEGFWIALDRLEAWF